ncbi:MAG: sulfatase family protein [Planctomycetota bacterium]|jgi:arylsulfatase A-like enzyme
MRLTVAGIAVSLVLGLFCPVAVEADELPNIILFYPDQLRAMEVGCYGNSVAQTPNLDSLAQQGVRFEYCVPGLPSCTPARACVLTGRMPFAVRSTSAGYDWMVVNKITMDTNEITIAEELNPLGYSCGHVGSKWHVEDTCGLCCIADRQGFTFFEGLNSYGLYITPKYCDNNNVLQEDPGRWNPDVMTERAINFITTNQGNHFYLNVWLCPPHATGGVSWGGWHEPADVFSTDRMHLWNESTPLTDDDLRDNVTLGEIGDYAKHQLQVYNAMTTGIDDCLGQIMTTLANLGIDHKTIIIVSADHGGQMGSHAVSTGTAEGWEKNRIYEESILVPLIVYDPRHTAPAAVRSELIPQMDLMPTILELVGAPPAQRAQGRSFAALITGQGTYQPRDAVMVQYDTTVLDGTGYDRSRALRTDRWKFAIMESKSVPGDVQAKALFDLDADPYELNNLINDPAYGSVREQLWERLMQEMTAVEDPLMIDMPSGYPHIDLGTEDDPNGLYLVDVSDGNTEAVNIGGRDAKKNLDPSDPVSPDNYMYFAIHDSVTFEGDQPDAYIVIDYYDTGTGTLQLQYDSSDPAPFPDDKYKTGGLITLTDSNTWKQHAYHVNDAWFGNGQNSGADFRISGGGSVFYLDLVQVFCPPVKVGDPDPADQADEVVLDVQLGWTEAVSFASSYDVYFGTINPPSLQGNETGTSFDPGILNPLTTYYWRINSVNGYYPAAAGDVWSFTTELPGDFDGDDDIDQEDFGRFQACLSGAGLPYASECDEANLDGDNDVDLNDFAIFQGCMGGANQPPDC